MTSNLYDRHKLILEKKQKAVDEEIQKANDIRYKNSKANKLSKQIVQQSRKNKINEIFDMLDSDKDGEISWSKVDLSSISTELMDVFKPLFEELE